MEHFAPSYTDLHCDTAFELYKHRSSLLSNSLHVSLEKAACFDNYTQVMAIWSDYRLSGEDAYQAFFEIRRRLISEIDKNSDKAALCLCYSDVEKARKEKKAAFILALEDARILCGDIRRLEALYLCGVRFLTLQWQGESCTGGGYDTDLPLTAFGRETVKGCFELGIIPDISHACNVTAAEMLDMARQYGKPVIATHSNARAVCPHPRNLTDGIFTQVAETGGVVGVSLHPPHLSEDENADMRSVTEHIRHWLSIGGAGHVCLGCDFDGIARTPDCIKDISHMAGLYRCLEEKGLPAKKIFSENANTFLSKYF